MTPTQQAQELVNSFMNIKPNKLSDYSVIYLPTAKQCALITVERLITEIRSKYWYDVKREIENL